MLYATQLDDWNFDYRAERFVGRSARAAGRTAVRARPTQAAGHLADGWVTQLLRQGDAKVFKKYPQMKREALQKLNRVANESQADFDTERPN